MNAVRPVTIHDIVAALRCSRPGCPCQRGPSALGVHRLHCPVCDPGKQHRTPSLMACEGSQGRVLVKCHQAGCPGQEAVINELRRRGLWSSRNGPGTDRGVRAASPGVSASPLRWWASHCAVPLEFVWTLPLGEEGDRLIFGFGGLSVRKLRRAGTKEFTWEPAGAEVPPLWPLPRPELPETIWICEGESDATILRFCGLEAYAVTKGAGGGLTLAQAQALRSRGVRRVVLAFDADDAGRAGAEKVAQVLRQAGLEVGVVDLVEAGLVDPLRGESDLRDAWRRWGDPDRLLRSLNSFQPIYICEMGGNEFVTAQALLTHEDVGTSWWWHGYMPAGGVVLASALPKAGKSTLVFHLLRALLDGEGSFLGRSVSFPAEAKVAVFCEEFEAKVADRLWDLGLGTDRILLAFKHRCQGRPLVDLVRKALDQGARIVVVDTVAAWAGIEDENVASEVEEALRPIVTLCQEHGAALVLLHHLRKTPGPEGTAHRGSGHLVALADVALELRRPEGGNAPPNRRVLIAQSRYSETPAELVIELGPDGYVALGSGEEVQYRRAIEALLDLLPGPAEEPIPFEARAKDGEEPPDTVMGRLADLRLPRSTVQRALAELVGDGLVERTGGGRRGDPYRYRLAPREEDKASDRNSFQPIYSSYMGGNESEPAEATSPPINPPIDGRLGWEASLDSPGGPPPDQATGQAQTASGVGPDPGPPPPASEQALRCPPNPPTTTCPSCGGPALLLQGLDGPVCSRCHAHGPAVHIEPPPGPLPEWAVRLAEALPSTTDQTAATLAGLLLPPGPLAIEGE